MYNAIMKLRPDWRLMKLVRGRGSAGSWSRLLSGAKDLLNTGRRYDMEEHAASLLEYLRIQEKNSDRVLPWNEYMDIFDGLVVRYDV